VAIDGNPMGTHGSKSSRPDAYESLPKRGIPLSNITFHQHHRDECTPEDIPNMQDICLLVATEKRLACVPAVASCKMYSR
jgi:hypothetical protein